MQISQKIPRGSYGLKLVMVCALVILMAIPAMFISYVSFERSSRADDVTQEVAQRYGGSQYISGPMLVVPYYKTGDYERIIETGEYVFFAEDGTADFSNVETEIRKRSLFKVPTFQASGDLSATFPAIERAGFEEGRTVLWDQARILIGLSDGRGLAEDIFLTTDTGQKLKFEPASAFSGRVTSSDPEKPIRYSTKHQHYNGLFSYNSVTFLSVPAGELLSGFKQFSVSASLKIGGATELGVYPYAKSTSVYMASDWASPGFTGGFAPIEREINSDGFTAKWSVPYLARGISGVGEAHEVYLFDPQGKAMITRFVAEVSPYQTVNRALKYAVLFIGLVFITFYLFEILVGVRVHPAQYILIGLAQAIFYLLLLALSEHLGFALAFGIAASAIIGLTSAYAGAVLGGKQRAIQAGGVFALTYGLLYSLMRMQDFALLLGALASFLTIALIMYLTRDLDWYGTGKDDPQLSFKTSPAK